MTLRGDLVRSRVTDDPGDALANALERTLTGYAVLEPQGTLLLDDASRGVLTLATGVPVAAHHTATGRGGADAVADLADRGPYRVELYDQTDPAERGTPVAPGVPAEILADDPALADRTRDAAPDDDRDTGGTESADAVEAFLENDEKIAAIQERAREEAAARAAEWGFDDV